MATVTSPNVPSPIGQQSGASGANGGDTERPAGAASAPEMVQSVAQGAHQTIDRLAEQVTPHVERLREGMASATQSMDERANQVREMTEEWLETLRSTVRENPLTAVGAALALGIVLARLSR